MSANEKDGDYDDDLSGLEVSQARGFKNLTLVWESMQVRAGILRFMASYAEIIPRLASRDEASEERNTEMITLLVESICEEFMFQKQDMEFFRGKTWSAWFFEYE
ncbi:hypothetical protein WAI453_002375 [Rhynchosporium graminicola]|uniref:Uncharacterized protein n=1 Tax=Rhynchosporium graminicola TaxID=2792576 RepID=A0A1E1KNV8_9HELO|nr:uncharacterized protein RCO7_07966 [Rhynchosporium commune]